MLLDTALQEYLQNVDKAVHGLEDSYVELYEEEIITRNRLNLRIRIRMSKGFLIELNEAVYAEGHGVHHLGYRYHFQDGQNICVFRYDNTPHFPGLKGFPEHKHIPTGVIEAQKPEIVDVLKEASNLLPPIW